MPAWVWVLHWRGNTTSPPPPFRPSSADTPIEMLIPITSSATGAASDAQSQSPYLVARADQRRAEQRDRTRGGHNGGTAASIPRRKHYRTRLCTSLPI